MAEQKLNRANVIGNRKQFVDETLKDPLKLISISINKQQAIN